MSYLFALLSPSCTELKALRDTATSVDSGNIKIDNSDHICICIWSIFALVKRLNWLVVVLGGSVRNSKVIFLSYTWEYVRLDAIRNTATSGSMYTILDLKKPIQTVLSNMHSSMIKTIFVLENIWISSGQSACMHIWLLTSRIHH